MRVAVIGAAGYVGGELLRILLSTHPEVREWIATSRSQAGKPVGDVHPGLALIVRRALLRRVAGRGRRGRRRRVPLRWSTASRRS